MKLYEQHDGDITVVAIEGRIDSNTAKEFGDKLTDLIKSGRTRLVIDFKNIVYISSAGSARCSSPRNWQTKPAANLRYAD